MAKKKTQFRAQVKFSTVSLGATAARLGVKLNRSYLPDLEAADGLFCQRRLIGTVVLGVKDEAAEQQALIEDADHKIHGAFDVKGYSVSSEYVAFGLTFIKKEIDLAELSEFANGTGTILITDITEIPDEPKAEPPVKGSGKLIPRLKGPWRSVRLDTLFDPEKTICKAFLNAGIETMGQYADYTASGKKTSDIDGLGPKKIEEIDARMVEFWKANPDADAQPEAAEAAAK